MCIRRMASLTVHSTALLAARLICMVKPSCSAEHCEAPHLIRWHEYAAGITVFRQPQEAEPTLGQVNRAAGHPQGLVRCVGRTPASAAPLLLYHQIADVPQGPAHTRMLIHPRVRSHSLQQHIQQCRNSSTSQAMMSTAMLSCSGHCR